jgi:hypothetical protein
MSLAGNIYRELLENDDPDDYAPPLFICLAIALYCWIPWFRVLRIFGLTVLIFCGIILLVY